MRVAVVLGILLALAGAGVLLSMLTAEDADRAVREGASREKPGTPSARDGTAPEEEARTGPEERARVFGVCRTEQGAPVSGVRVRARSYAGAGAIVAEQTATTAADGRFSLAAARPGWVEVVATHPDYQRGEKWLQAGGEPGEIVLLPGAPLRVVVLHPDRTPAAGARVACRWTVQASWEDVQGKTHTFDWTQESEPVLAGEDGSAALGAFPGPELTVWAETAAAARTSRAVELRGTDPVEVEIVLQPGGTIEGRVFDAGGTPVEGARVHPPGDDLRVVTTDAEGRYRLPAVGPGDVHLVAESDRHAPTPFGGTLGWGRSVPIPVDAREVVTGIDFVLGPGSFLEGRVVDEAGDPLPGMHVLVNFEWGMAHGADGGKNGTFRLGPLAVPDEGGFEVSATGPGHELEARRFEALRPGEARQLGDLVARALETIEGRVIDATGAPATEGTVTLSPGHANARIRPDGTFTLYGARAEGAVLSAFANEPYRVSQPFRLEADRDEPIVLVLESTYAIGGAVQTPQGKPRPAVAILCRPKDTGDHRQDESTATDADGRFRLEGLRAGTWLVGFSDWAETDGVWHQDFEPGTDPIEVEAGREDVLLALPFEGGWVTGHVVRKADARPVTEFGVAIYKYTLFVPSWEDSERFDDAQGRFRLEIGEEGTYALDLHADGLASVRTDKFTLKAGQTVDVGTIALGAGGAITGRVEDAAGDPVQWARIYVLNAKLQTNDDAPWTDRKGRYTVAGLTPGVYQVFAVSPRHALTLVKGVEVGEGVAPPLPIRFGDSAPLTLRVVDEQNTPVPAAELTWGFPALAPFNSSHFGAYEPPGFGSNESDAEGRIRKPFLPVGPVTWRVEADGYAAASGTVELEAGVPATVEVRLVRAGPR